MPRDERLFIEEKARVLKALGHPTRLQLFEELRNGERCVCDLANTVGAGFPAVSKHLSVLKQAGLVDDDKRGQQVFYKIRVPCIFQFINCIEAVIENRVRSDAALVA
jgi:ArsR family transcriptional regulator